MTTWWGWLIRHSLASKGLVATLFALVAATSGIIGASVGQGGIAATGAARQAIADAPPEAAGLQLQTRLGPDPAAQDRLARDRLGQDFAPVPVRIWTTITTDPRRLSAPAKQVRMAVLAGDHLKAPDLKLQAGQWPAPGSKDGALHAAAATALGLGVGDLVVLGETSIRIAATWLPTAPEDARWFGDQVVRNGSSGDVVGPIVVDPALVLSLGTDPFIRWEVTPDLTRLEATDLPHLASSAERAAGLAGAADVTGRGLTSSGDLAPTAVRAAADSESSRAMSLVPLSLLVLIAVVGLVQVTGILAEARQRESQLLVARGAGFWQVFGTGIAESVLVALAGGVVGTGGAALVVGVLAGSAAQTSTIVAAGGFTLSLAVAALVLVAWTRARRLVSRVDRTLGRVRAVAGLAVAVLLGALAALSLWQLIRAGAVVDSDPGGRVRTNYLAALAPGLGLAAVTVTGLVLLAPTTRLLERIAARSRGAVTFLAMAQLARGLVANAVVVALTVLATGAITLAAFFTGTASTLHRDLALLSTGAPLRAQLAAAPPATGALAFPDVAGTTGVNQATAVWLDTAARVGDLTATAVVANPATLSRVALAPTGAKIPVEQLSPSVAGSAQPLALPSGVRRVDFTLAGAVKLDPWQEQVLQLLPEQMAETIKRYPPTDPSAPGLAEQVRSSLEAQRAPIQIDMQVSVRDQTTGQSAVLMGPTLNLPGPSASWAGGEADIVWRGSTATATGSIEVPERGKWVIDSVRLKILNEAFGAGGQDVELSVALTADGKPLLGKATAAWQTDKAIPVQQAGPYRDAAAAASPPKAKLVPLKISDQEILGIESNQPPSPPMADLSGATWSIRARPMDIGTLNIAPQVRFRGIDPLRAMTKDSATPEPRIPVVLSRALAEQAALGFGDSFELVTMSKRIPVSVVAVTDAIVGSTSPASIFVPAGPFSQYLSMQNSALPWPTEIWATVDAPGLAAASVAALTGIKSVVVAGTTPIPSAAGETGRGFAVAAGAGAGLALVGIAAAAATSLTHRRREVAVLLALGMPPRQQSHSRRLELAVSVVLAAGVGIAGGWLTSLLAIVHVARSGTRGMPALPAPLHLDWGLFAVLLGAFLALAVSIAFVIGWLVRRQTVDDSYREDVT